MATPVKSSTKPIYEQDFYAWSKAEADLLRAGRYADRDLGHLIEEVDDLGESLYRSARSRMRTVIEHLLKLEHPSSRDPRAGWVETVMRQRSDLEDELTASLRPRIEQVLARTYDQARRNTAAALREHGDHATADALPATCPYSFDQITGDWLP
jgi:Domain of unknown function DUF29